MNIFSKKRLLAMLLALSLLLMSVPAAIAEEVAKVTVYFTLSNNGTVVLGADGQTPLSNLKVTVPYFPLEPYGLQQYNRYEKEGFNDDGYSSTTVVQKPTLLHVYIWMLERYYLGMSEDLCGKGINSLTEERSIEVYDVNDTLVGNQGKALVATGAATSMYMTSFWGHGCNLMYFVDHQYPLEAPGWGATADYILLKDGQRIDVAMFTDMQFYQRGSFMYFDQDEYSVEAGKPHTFSVFKSETSPSVQGNSGSSEYAKGVLAADAKFSVYDEDMTQSYAVQLPLDENASISYTFNEPGIYKIIASDPDQSTENAANAPATATVHVVAASEAISLQSISFEQDEYEIQVGETFQIAPVLNPDNATGVTLSWKSSDTSAVGVTPIGVLTGYGAGKSNGEVIITCTATQANGTSMDATCTVKVADFTSVEGVALQRKSYEVEVGKTVQLNAVITPANANTKSKTWRTGECPDFDTNYTDEQHTTAKVDHLGAVTGKQEGIVTVKVKTTDGGFVDECTVVVGKKLGDVSGEGKLTVKDAMLVAQYKVYLTTFDEDQLVLADVSGDGKVTVKDAMLIAQKKVNLVGDFNSLIP